MTLISASGWAKIQVSRTRPVVFPKSVVLPSSTKSEIETYMPRKLNPTSDPNHVMNQFGDGMIQAWINSPQIQQSAIGKTVQNVESQMGMRTEMSLSGPSSSSSKGKSVSESKPSVQHRIGFEYQLLQTTAKVEYKGWVRAAVNHNTQSRESMFEVSDTILKNKDLVLSHRATADQGSSSNLGVRWSW